MSYVHASRSHSHKKLRQSNDQEVLKSQSQELKCSYGTHWRKVLTDEPIVTQSHNVHKVACEIDLHIKISVSQNKVRVRIEFSRKIH